MQDFCYEQRRLYQRRLFQIIKITSMEMEVYGTTMSFERHANLQKADVIK